MSQAIYLFDKAHCRFGDKGDTGLYILIPYDEQDFETLLAVVTPEAVGQHLGGLPPESVICRPTPALKAMVIVVRSSLGGGVTASLSVDAHGKTLSGYLLDMLVDWPAP
jgi:hypothetical protein